jgi:cell division protein FtsW (lipid II flippase)
VRYPTWQLVFVVVLGLAVAVVVAVCDPRRLLPIIPAFIAGMVATLIAERMTGAE